MNSEKLNVRRRRILIRWYFSNLIIREMNFDLSGRKYWSSLEFALAFSWSPTPTLNTDKRSSGRSGDSGPGFFYVRYGSAFDLACRALKNKSAPTIPEVPPHSFIAHNRIVIGIHQEATAKT